MERAEEEKEGLPQKVGKNNERMEIPDRETKRELRELHEQQLVVGELSLFHPNRESCLLGMQSNRIKIVTI